MGLISLIKPNHKMDTFKKLSYPVGACALVLVSTCSVAADYPPISPPQSMSVEQKIAGAARWLNSITVDVTRKNTAIPAQLPRFVDDNWQDYWAYLAKNNSVYQSYRNMNDTRSCVVNNRNDATIERVITHNGAEVYDASVWQIALSLALSQTNPSFSANDRYKAQLALRSYEQLLTDDNPTYFNTYRAYESPKNFQYGVNGVGMASAFYSYIRRFMAPTWADNPDPLNNCNMQWPEWSAVTGEEVWAMLIGPLQTSYLAQPNDNQWIWNSRIDYLSIPAITPLMAMQDPTTGALYRNVVLPDNSNSGEKFSISLENNFSAYAGLKMLQKALQLRENAFAAGAATAVANGQRGVSLQSTQQELANVDKLIGGLEDFFTNKSGKAAVWNKEGGYFVSSLDKQNGAYAMHASNGDNSEFAVDVQTWGATVLIDYPGLAQKVEQVYGTDMFGRMWSAMREKGGYQENGQLLGVGYGTQDPSQPYYQMSGEWTLGAINAAFAIASYTRSNSTASEVIDDARTMLKGIDDRIATVYPDNSKRLGYLYSNKRALIPFGWYSNAMPSTASTGWALMVNSCFDPFVLGGAMDRKDVCAAVVDRASVTRE
jgi:hypothetical protein